MSNMPNMPQPGVSFEQTEAIICNKCEGELFNPVVMLRKVSALVSPTGKETVVPVQLFACIKCGHVNKDMYPIE